MRAVARWALLVAVPALVSCEGTLPGDTQGEQRSGQWWEEATLVVSDDTVITLRRVGVEPGNHDVVVGIINFDPAPWALGDEYSLSFAIDLGRADSLDLRTPHEIGGPNGLRAASGSRIGMGPILRADSIRGQFMILTRGIMQMIGRLEADFFFSQWGDSSKVVKESVRQRVDFVRPEQRSP